ncbi:MAG: cation:proton antiporter [Phototrophicaceae bacterium]
MPEIPSIVIFSVSFFLIALAAKQIGKFFSSYGLPYITGYLLAGALAGPFILGMLPKEASEQLRYIDDISLAVIAFIAGSELYLKELRSKMRTILTNTAGIVVAAFSMIGVALFFAQSFIPFTADYPFMTKLAVSLLGATILLALSPASTIAVIQEVKAKGPFSKTVLSITVVMDVVIIVMFAVSVAFASAMIDGTPVTISFLLILILDIFIAIVAGFLLGKLIGLVLSTPLAKWVKAIILLLFGYIIFESGYHIPDLAYDAIGIKIKIEPLLIAMVAGFTVTNFTKFRQPFEDLLHDISPYVYVAFFALTGVALKLDILVATIGIASVLFLVRMLAIIIGTYVGGTIAGEDEKFRKWAGLGLITQAGIALGLARETAVEFPDTLGGDFATLIIAVVVLNEVFGPLLLKFALRKVGEARTPDGERNRQLLVLGVEPQSIALARQMNVEGWNVVLADTNKERIESLQADDVDERHIEAIDKESLDELIKGSSTALVTMLDDDTQNYEACKLASEEFDIESMVVRLRDVSLRDKFLDLGVRVLDPASAMVSLLNQYLRAPEAVNLLLHQNPDHDVMQVRVTERAMDGLQLRDLRLPSDVLILEILRDGQVIVPHGFSTLKMADEVTIIGSPNSLTEVTLKLGY